MNSWLGVHFRQARDASYARRALERYRMGMRAGGAIRGVRVMVGADSCRECQGLAGQVYSLEGVPTLPHAGCTSPGGCRCVYRPVMAYEETESGESAESD